MIVFGAACVACLLLATATSASSASTTSPSLLLEEGLTRLRNRGCLACHTDDGRRHVGPTFLGLAGSRRKVLRAGTPVQLVADDAYLRRAITDPNADVAEGFTAGTMPPFQPANAEMDAMMAALKHLGSKSANSDTTPWMWILGLCSVGFVFFHVALSSIPVRRRLIDKVGRSAFLGIYSSIVVVTFVGTIFAWRKAPYVELWSSPGWTGWFPLLIMPLSFILLVASFTTKSPTITEIGGAALDQEDPAVGFLKITRHPMLWSFVLWGISHLVRNGDLAALFLFGSIVALALIGMVHIDGRRFAEHGSKWLRFANKTSLIPFVAVLEGRAALQLSDIGLYRPLGGIALYVFYLAIHTWFIGASPFPF